LLLAANKVALTHAFAENATGMPALYQQSKTG
jgi:hypothetical protein